MADEKPGDTPEPAEVDIDAIDDLPQEDFDKLKRGEIEPPKKGAKADGTRDEFEVDPKSETVPHGQFHRVNERRKAAEAETAKERTAREQAESRANTAMQRMAELLEASKPPAPEVKEQEPDLGPDPDEDPIGALKWAREQKAQEFEQRKQFEAQQVQRAQHERVVNAQSERFRSVQAEHPVLTEAYQSLLNSWGHELSLQGFKGRDVQARVNQLETQWAAWAHQHNQPIEDVIWNLAQSRGFRMKEPDADPSPEAAATGADAAATPQRDANGKFVAASAAMDKREATKAAAKSLGGSGGPADTGELTPQMIADMSNEDFAAFKKKFGDKAMAKAFGVAR
jgi:hypothetical protein